jgi:hypothetical protein
MHVEWISFRKVAKNMENTGCAALHFCPMIGLPSTTWVGQDIAVHMQKKGLVSLSWFLSRKNDKKRKRQANVSRWCIFA